MKMLMFFAKKTVKNNLSLALLCLINVFQSPGKVINVRPRPTHVHTQTYPHPHNIHALDSQLLVACVCSLVRWTVSQSSVRKIKQNHEKKSRGKHA